jgi:hypothetical protein
MSLPRNPNVSSWDGVNAEIRTIYRFITKLWGNTGESTGGTKGDTGATGAKGDKGDTGAVGVGVPTVGTTGQHLKKNSNTNYDTVWSTYNADWTAASGDAQILNKPVLPKVYRCYFDRLWNNAPAVAEEIYNSLGGTPVFSRSSAGMYSITLEGAFPEGKVFVPLRNKLIVGQVSYMTMFYDFYRVSNDVISMLQYDPGCDLTSDDESEAMYSCNNVPLEIYVYP